jgi:hypothetical protein
MNDPVYFCSVLPDCSIIVDYIIPADAIVVGSHDVCLRALGFAELCRQTNDPKIPSWIINRHSNHASIVMEFVDLLNLSPEEQSDMQRALNDYRGREWSFSNKSDDEILADPRVRELIELEVEERFEESMEDIRLHEEKIENGKAFLKKKYDELNKQIEELEGRERVIKQKEREYKIHYDGMETVL